MEKGLRCPRPTVALVSRAGLNPWFLCFGVFKNAKYRISNTEYPIMNAKQFVIRYWLPDVPARMNLSDGHYSNLGSIKSLK
jgi:hypothetical protein